MYCVLIPLGLHISEAMSETKLGAIFDSCVAEAAAKVGAGESRMVNLKIKEHDDGLITV